MAWLKALLNSSSESVSAAFPFVVDKNFLRATNREHRLRSALFRYKGLFHSGIVSRFRVGGTGKLLGGVARQIAVFTLRPSRVQISFLSSCNRHLMPFVASRHCTTDPVTMTTRNAN
jgi:hypothetical protein